MFASDCVFELIDHPPYCPDLDPSDFHQKSISGTHCGSDDDVIHAVEDCVNGPEKDFCKSGIEALKHHLFSRHLVNIGKVLRIYPMKKPLITTI